MATINLGRIKPVNKGVWSNSTAYAVDDFVQYTDNGITSTYIAIATSTNQAPSTSGTENSTYWKFMAKGVASELSGIGNNQIVLKNNSGNITGQSIGTAGQVLKVNSGANGYEFGTISSEIVKLAEVTTSSNASTLDMHGYFDDSAYYSYFLKASIVGVSTNAQSRMRWLTASNTPYTSSTHAWAHDYSYRHNNGNTQSQGHNFGSNLSDQMRFSDWSQMSGRTYELRAEFCNPTSSSAYKTNSLYCSNGNDGDSYHVSGSLVHTETRTNTAFTGLRIYLNSGYYLDGSVFKLYGWKK